MTEREILLKNKSEYPECDFFRKIGKCKDCGDYVFYTSPPPKHVTHNPKPMSLYGEPWIDQFGNNWYDSYDFWYFCHNPNCKHHYGFPMDDMEYNYNKEDLSWIDYCEWEGENI